MQQFTRRETVILTRTSLGRLNYLAKTGMVVPVCLRDDQRHQLYYSWEQILELRAIRHLRCQVSLQMIRKILSFLESRGDDRRLHDKHLVIDEDKVDWIQIASDRSSKVIQVAARTNQHIGQLKLTSLPAGLSSSKDALCPCPTKVIDLESFRQRWFQPQSDE